MWTDYRKGDLVWIPPIEGVSGSCGIVESIGESSLHVLFPEFGVVVELARGWFAPFPVSGSIAPSWIES